MLIFKLYPHLCVTNKDKVPFLLFWKIRFFIHVYTVCLYLVILKKKKKTCNENKLRTLFKNKKGGYNSLCSQPTLMPINMVGKKHIWITESDLEIHQYVNNIIANVGLQSKLNVLIELCISFKKSVNLVNCALTWRDWR